MTTISMSAPTAYSPVSGSNNKAGRTHRSLFGRFLDRMVEARMREAEKYLRQHRHLLPRELEQAGWKVTERSEDSLPFLR